MKFFDLKQERDWLWKELALCAGRCPFEEGLFRLTLERLSSLDRFWTFPGRGVILRLFHYLHTGQLALMTQLVHNCLERLDSSKYRLATFSSFTTNLSRLDRPLLHEQSQLDSQLVMPPKPYFEVLIVHPFPENYEMLYRQGLVSFLTSQDEFIYDIVLTNSAQDALTAALVNPDIQAVVYLDHLPISTEESLLVFPGYTKTLLSNLPPIVPQDSVGINLCRSLRLLRPEIDHYLISEQSSIEIPINIRQLYDRVLFHVNPFQDLHAALLNGVRNRYSTPFFDALRAYSRHPKGVFHALPLSRGSSVKDSPWIHDMLDFYGENIFLAETSSTQGGLDSLLDPTGVIKQAHLKAAETFGADHSYFVTNGTSTSNKIVMQANLQPGDLILVSADCHKSIPYSIMLAGAFPVFLETYPLVEYDLYGGIDLAQIKAVMLDLKKHNRLHLLKQITLTNSTFDGLIYNSENFMMEILAIKPEIIFHWDEAWFAFAHFHPLYFGRTAMTAVAKMRQRFQTPEYRLFYTHWSAQFEANPDPHKWQQTLYPDPDKVCLRVYVTQSTHKTLTSFRQGSMVHIADDAFDQARFLEAFRIHTSTSPNYQIIASLDIARRQVALEGFHRVRESIQLSLQLRQRIQESEQLRPYFEVLEETKLIPRRYQSQSDHRSFLEAPEVETPTTALVDLARRWDGRDFVVDPTRITLDVSKSGIDGSSFRALLMTRYDIQVNKTSRHTVLFLINIGVTQSTIDYLIQVLLEMASKFTMEGKDRLKSLGVEGGVPLPERRLFHPAFTPYPQGEYLACDLRGAYFSGTIESHVEYLPLSNETIEAVKAGKIWVSASFVTPYPPGFPVMVPGQILTSEILGFFKHSKIKEIHGYSSDRGFKVFTETYLNQLPLPTGA